MTTYTFHISFFDLASLGAIFIGLTFALQLWFVKGMARAANRYLSAVLAVMILWMMRTLAIDIRLGIYQPGWDRLPMQFLLALGPLIYFYVLKKTNPEYKLSWKDLLHFTPLLLEQGALAIEIAESVRTGAATYATSAFQWLNPLLQLLIFISITTYLYYSHQLIQNFYRLKAPVFMDRSLLEFRWLDRLLGATGLLWLLWISYTAVDYFVYHGQLGLRLYYPVYVFFAVIIIWTAAAAFLRPQQVPPDPSIVPAKTVPPFELKEKAAWLKRTIEAGNYYQDSDLSLGSLAAKLDLTPHELSRIINSALKKSFSDFINEYRVQHVIYMMQDPAYDHITLLGIAYAAGFNSKATFNRSFREVTGATPLAYKRQMAKDVSYYNLRRTPRTARLISTHDTTTRWPEKKLSRNYMLKNYLKISFRYLMRHKEYTLINILGLAVSVTCCLLIMLFVRSELSYDAFHPKASRIYRVWQREKADNITSDNVFTPLAMASAIKSTFPETEAASHVLAFSPIVKTGANSFKETMDLVDPDFFKMFNFKVIAGNASSPLSLDNNIVLTAATAKKYFGDANPIGKSVELQIQDDKVLFTVSAVVDDAPETSSIRFNALLPFSAAKHIYPQGAFKNWFAVFTESYILVKPGVNASALESKFPQMMKQQLGEDYGKEEFTVHLQPIKDIHLNTSLPPGNQPTSDPKYSYILGSIGLLILIVACINFVTLSIGQSTKRAMEVGVRKALGAARKQLIIQFWGEAFLVVLISVTIGVVLALVTVQPFNDIVNRQLSLHPDLFFALFCLLVIALIAIISGIYPALILSGFNPVEVLKGKLNLKAGSNWLRQGLVIGQFVASIVMIIGTVVIGRQMDYMQQKDLGYKKEQVVVVETNKNMTLGQPVAATFRAELNKYSKVINSSISLYSMAEIPWIHLDYKDDHGQVRDFLYNSVDANFVPTMGIKMVSGRNFAENNAMDVAGTALVNETFIKAFNITDPIGKKLPGPFPQIIIGVMKDFNYESLHGKIQPLILSGEAKALMKYANDVNVNAPPQPRISVRLGAGSLSSNIGILKKAWTVAAPGQDLDYSFLDDTIAAQYRQEQRSSLVVRIASCLSIFIACMGLFGLATITVARRVKEIGVRKVLGARVGSIVQLLSVDFVKLVLIAAVIASPIAWWAMNNWLQDFDYRIDVSWWIFVLAGGAAILIALVTVSYHSIKAALVNPVKSLRSE
ncbi:MAG: ABC transporter permease [Mucilaginibacter sp.]